MISHRHGDGDCLGHDRAKRDERIFSLLRAALGVLPLQSPHPYIPGSHVPTDRRQAFSFKFFRLHLLAACLANDSLQLSKHLLNVTQP